MNILEALRIEAMTRDPSDPLAALFCDAVKSIERRQERIAGLPPLPWDWVAAGVPTANGMFQAYLVDKTGRKIAAIWGKGAEKELIADYILECCNPQQTE